MTLPPVVTPDQLEHLDKLTRAGIDARLKVLENVQATLWKCAEDLTLVRSVLPDTSVGAPPAPPYAHAFSERDDGVDLSLPSLEKGKGKAEQASLEESLHEKDPSDDFVFE